MSVRRWIMKWCPQPENPISTTLRNHYKPLVVVLSASMVLVSLFLFSLSSLGNTAVPPILIPDTQPTSTSSPTPYTTVSPSTGPQILFPQNISVSLSPTNQPLTTPVTSPSSSPLVPFSPTLSPSPPVIADPGSWSSMTPMPTARSSLGVAVVNGKIFAIGGFVKGSLPALGTNEMYDPVTNTWTSMASMPTPRVGFGIAEYEGKIYCIGGSTGPNQEGGGVVTGVNEVYDPKTNSWEIKSSLNTPREQMSINIVDGKIYVIGGIEYLSFKLDSKICYNNDIYDPALDIWSIGAPVPNSAFSCASSVVDDKIYVVDRDYNQVYDTQTDNWSLANPAPSSLWGLGAGGAATSGAYAPKLAYVIGGRLSTRGATSGVDLNQIYNP
jgi:N-acetylneuraminic acid mutarotase